MAPRGKIGLFLVLVMRKTVLVSVLVLSMFCAHVCLLNYGSLRGGESQVVKAPKKVGRLAFNEAL